MADERAGDAALERITSLSVAAIDACAAASLSIARPEGVATRAATGLLAEVMDEIQYRTGEGPCLEAIRTGAICRGVQSSGQSRWPAFWREGQAQGLTRTFSAPVRLDHQSLGSLNLYVQSGESDMSEHDELLATLLAGSAAIALATDGATRRHAALVEQLNQALVSRDVIGQAKGILMVREGCTADEAFDMLRRASQRLNQKLRDVAEQISQSTSACGSPGAGGSRGGGGSPGRNGVPGQGRRRPPAEDPTPAPHSGGAAPFPNPRQRA
jgi:hypothetical protein